MWQSTYRNCLYIWRNARKTVFIFTKPATPVWSHLKLHNKCSLCLNREHNSLEEMLRLFATDCDLTAKRPVVWVRHVFIMGCLVWPLGVLSAQRRLWSVFVALCSLSTAQMLPSALIKRAPCVCFSQPLNSSGFSRRSPHWSFLAVQNNFLGWLYAIHCQSKLQPCAEMARKRNGVVSKHARGKHGRDQAELTAAWLPPATIQQDW